MSDDAQLPVPSTGRRRGILWAAGIAVLLLVALGIVFGVRTGIESGYQSQDVANIRQIGLAAVQYRINHDDAPADEPPPPELVVRARLSWLSRLLHYLERYDLYQRLDFDKRWDLRPNHEVTQTSFDLFQSYADPCEPGHTNFVGVGGLGSDAPTLPGDHPRAGYFGHERIALTADLKDGESNTLMVIETHHNPGPWGQNGPSTIRPLDPDDPPYIGRNAQFGRSTGAAVAFADSHARFLDAAIDPKVLEALSTINGGEALPGF